MASGTSVVTPERFKTGMTSFQEWMDAIEVRKEEFQRHYDEFKLSDDDAAYLRSVATERGVKALVLGEDWCPDVWRGLPVMARIAEATGMEVRFFPRDKNKDIMAEFLNKGEFESIPTIVFYDGEHNYLGHWIERAVAANEGLAELRKRLFPAEMPDRESAEYAELMTKQRVAAIDEAEPWRQAQVQEMRALLEQALG